MTATREAQYAPCFDEEPVTLGPMTGATFHWNPARLGWMLARYKFVAKMFEHYGDVAEIGCADAFGSNVVARAVERLSLFDFDPVFVAGAGAGCPLADKVAYHDILTGPLPALYDGIYLLDVLEHIAPKDEPTALGNIAASLRLDGTCIIGMPSLESQPYASPISKAGHVNCKTGDDLRAVAKQHFRNVFLFGMNDEVLHTGFSPMCHYIFVLCTGPLSRVARSTTE